MITDSKLLFGAAKALSTAGTGLALVGDVIDTATVRDLGQGRPLYLFIDVDTAVTSAGAATVSFQLVSDAAAAIAVDGSAMLHFQTFAFPKASLVAGFVVVEIPLPFDGGQAYKQFLGIIQNVGTAALTAGKINAFLALDLFGWKSYPSANS